MVEKTHQEFLSWKFS